MSVNKLVMKSGYGSSDLVNFIQNGHAPALTKFTNLTIDTTKMWGTNDCWFMAKHKNMNSWMLGMSSGSTTYCQNVGEMDVSKMYYDSNNLRFELDRNDTYFDTFIDIDGGDTGCFGFLAINSSNVITDYVLTAVSDDCVTSFFKGYSNNRQRNWYCFQNNSGTVRRSGMISEVDSYNAQRKALANAWATEYSAQPVVAIGTKTPVYSITCNANSPSPELYTEIVIGGQRFFVVETDLAVKC